MSQIREGSTVEWDWGNGTAEGKVQKTYTRKITRKIKGNEVTRDGSDDDPALFIEQEDGDEVLKLKSEVRPK
ncbi:DUF2945 domain-containing protein [Sulfitobacter alexandrii]|uniref:DUF2945 domain-containing protein n=1 Tax=Sulfitobacter alexandrii TaxID=1917485 RepID=A0A1J0WJM4_9RHOB|nr:DUF2945 domain-containing protein [Sulfitobacter alexandrii]APE44524.1 DUF2945 domain-containing protein [Sulfitobacter alexandrii]